MPFQAIKAVSLGCTQKHQKNNEGQTPLHIACERYFRYKYSQEESPISLLKVVSNVESINVQDASRNSPLHYACKCNDSEAILFLMSNFPCDVNLLNHRQCLPLHYALESRQSLAAIEAISTKCTQKYVQNNLGKTPLHLACEILSVNSKHLTNNRKLLEAVSDSNSINAQDSCGNTALHIACKKGDEKSVLYIISELNCDVDIQNHKFCLALHIALMSHMPIEVIKEICHRCTQKHKKNEVGKTPLHIACENAKFYHDNKWQDLLELICESKSLNIQDADGNTPLHIACKRSDTDTAFYLVSKKFCDVNLLNYDQCLPLHYAVKSSKAMELVKIVSPGCTQIHVQDKNGMTALHYVCKQNNIQVVKYLLFESGSFLKYVHQSAVYDDLIIHFACETEAEFPLLKALANEKNANIKPYYSDTCIGDRPIHVALANQNLLAIELLSITLTCDLSHKDSLGRLPLHIACSKSLKCVEMIISRISDDDVNLRDESGNTPLHVAVKQSLVDIVRFLLKNYNYDVNISNKEGELPLHIACKINSLEMIKILVEAGASAQSTSQTNDGNSPLHIACRNGAIEIVEYLVEACNCRPSMILRNDRGRLPVDYACKHSLQMVELVSQSCSVKDLVSREYKITNYYRHRDKPTTLDIACCSGLLDVVMYLINERGCSLSALANNHSALAYACGMNHDYDKTNCWPNIVRFLIGECGYDPSLSFNYDSFCSHACQLANFELLKALTFLMVDIIDSEGNSPLHYASLYNCVEIAQFLVDHECDQTVINHKGELAIHIACRTSLEITKLLMHCDTHSLNADGNAPLHVACSNKMEDIVRYLVDELKCDVNMPNGNGECALHLACKRSFKIETLVQKCDINSLNGYGETSLLIACSKLDYGMILFLLSHGCRADIPDTDGNLALHTLISARNPYSDDYEYCYSEDELDIPQVLELLLERNMTAVLSPNHANLAPIDMAVASGDIDFLGIVFIKTEIDTSTKSRLLHIACSHGMSKSISWLIENGAICSTDDEGHLPQHIICVQQYHSEVLKALGPIDITKEDKDKNTVLHLACKNSSKDVLQYILQSFNTISKCFSIQNMENDILLFIYWLPIIYFIILQSC
jgi:ankyrin repeat protein